MSRRRPFERPNYTQIPNVFLDEIMVDLSPSELRVMLYIMRRTFGFQKDADTISLKQMTDGIMTRDGRQLDRGAGVSKASATAAVKGLLEKGLIVADRNRSDRYGDEATTYSVSIEPPVFNSLTRESENYLDPGSEVEHGGVQDLDPQKKVPQKKVQKSLVHDAKRPPLTPRDLHELDPFADRDIILRGRVRPEPPDDARSIDEITAWVQIQEAWDRRHGRP